MFRSAFLTLLLLSAVWFIAANEAQAHRIGVFAAYDDGLIVGNVYVGGGGPVKAAPVRIYNDTTGELLAETISDDDGNFFFRPTVRCDHRIVVQPDAAHRAEFVLTADELPESLGAPEDADHHHGHAHEHSHDHRDDMLRMVESAVSRQITPLRIQLDRFQKSRRLLDIIGGIGYIFGLAGVVFFMLARKKAQG